MAFLRTMTISDYESVIQLMKDTPGVSLRDADSREATARYLERNLGMSFVAEHGGRVIGCIMCGHDGRRGYLQHLVVHAEHRRQGIANALVSRCLASLEDLGIFKSHIDVFRTNEVAQAYWESQGWMRRTDIHRYSRVSNGNANA
ncbi:GNAT family N-acetyltransferase [Hylemonella gracilis]|jgi:ribosomal protein S18 acetylase RimI-like enzyme|uniref:GNAT family N-acetyltransferase n=1 Tax=Hylemonella gracilis TaxID=80880 RepID=A0A4P6UNC6_9BURK|nr:GNAT family N-acetyltransferase [Hylemonella gracilis]QBK05605.1 GNAT family N-acetyltransferase [Hylemonella gracilis]